MTARTDPALTVVTYNIHKGFSALNRRLVVHEIRERLHELAPDVVFLQEVQGAHQRHSRRHVQWPQAAQHEFLAHEGGHTAYGRNAVYRDGHHGNAIVSRFPIVRRDSLPKVRFELNGTQQSVKRGFLDVTVQVTPGYQLRCVGAHLKSKLPTPEGEALIRRHEAAKLRGQLDAVLKAEPAVNLLCYGDFNDSKNQPMFTEITGVRGTPSHMTDLPARDSHGDRWTHHWNVADEYSRIDYLFASPGRLPEVKRDTATVYRSEFWETASDHRPVFVTILPVDKRR